VKLLTKDIERALLAAPKDQDPESTPILLKLFTPWAGATWYVTEAERLEDGDLRLFVFADLGDLECAELGYALLSQIAELCGPGRLKVERDLYFPPTTLADVLRSYGKL
jgi:hypothetical protein